MTSSFKSMIIPIFSTTVYAYCIFILFSFVESDQIQSYNFFVAFICAMVSALINYRFSRHERTILSIVVLNAVLITLTIFFCISAPNDIEGVWFYIIASLCFSAPVVHGLMLSRSPIKTKTMLLYCEISVAGTTILFALQLGELFVSAFTIVISIVALILNLFMLSLLRITGPAKKTEGGRKGIERGVLLTSGLVGIVFAAVAVALFILPASRGAILAIISAVRTFFIFVGNAIMSFFEWLSSLMPDMGPVEMDIVAEATASGEAELLAEEELPENMLVWIIIIAVAVLIGILLVILLKNRKKMLRARITGITVYEEETTEKPHWLRALFELPSRFRRWLFYQTCKIRRRGTYEEAYLRIAKYAKRQKYIRAESETSGNFLKRIAMSLAHKPEKDFDERLAGLLDSISAAVDKRLYSNKNTEYSSLSAGEAEILYRFLATIKIT